MASPDEPLNSQRPHELATGSSSCAGGTGAIRILRAEGSTYGQACGLLRLSSDLSAEAADRSVIFVAQRDGRVVAAVSVDPRSVVQASCSQPKAFGEVRDDTLVQLLGAARDFVSQQTTRLITALVDPESTRARSVFTTAGFEHAGDVSFCLCHPHRFPSHVNSPLTLKSAGQRQAELAEVMQRTCENTLDLPKLLSVWSPSDMLAHLESLPGHRPDLWFIATYDEANVGTLLLECDEHECRLTYFGLVPEFRGRGWGHDLLGQAMQIAATQHISRMVLSVDCSNLPALRIYEKAGFLSYLTQSVFFCGLDGRA